MPSHNPIPEGLGPVIGPGDPGAIGAGRDWINSTTGERKTRNLADDGWITTTALADFADAALTGVPTAPTADAGTNTTQIATTAFVTAAITAALG